MLNNQTKFNETEFIFSLNLAILFRNEDDFRKKLFQ